MIDQSQVHPPDRLRGLVKILVALGIVCVITNSFYFWWKRNNPPTPTVSTHSAGTTETIDQPTLPPQLQAAIQRQEQWIVLHPHDTQVRLSLAELHIEGRQFPFAITHLLAAKTQQPRNAEIPYLLATVYMQQRQPSEALKHVQQALLLSPKHQESRELLGHIYLAQDRYTDALRTFNQYLQKTPRSATAWLGKAKSLEQIYTAQKTIDTGEFIKAATKAVEIEPSNVQSLSVLARMIFTYQGQMTQAEKLARRAIDIDPNFAQPYLILVEILLRQPTPTQLNEALSLGERASQLDTRQPEPLYLLARVQMQKGLVHESIQSLERSLQLRALPQAIYLLSQAYVRVGDTEKAKHYSRIYKEWNDFTEQKKVLLGQLKHTPRDVNIYCQLIRLYLSRGNYEVATNWLRQAQSIQKNHPQVQQLASEIKKYKR